MTIISVKSELRFAQKKMATYQYQGALTHTYLALNLWDRIGQVNHELCRLKCAILFLRMKVLRCLGMHEEAAICLTEVMGLTELLKDLDNISLTFQNAGLNMLRQFNYSEALKQFQYALRIERQLHNLKGIAACYDLLGISFKGLKKLNSAEKSFERALTLKENLRDQKGIADSYRNMASLLTKGDNAAQAFQLMKQAIQIKHDEQDKEGFVACYFQLANMFCDKKNHLDQLNVLEKLNIVLIDLKHTRGLLRCYNEQAMAYVSLNKHRTAVDYFTKSLVIATHLKDFHEIWFLRFSLGHAWYRCFDFERAKQEFQLLLKLSIKSGSKMSIACAYLDIGEVLCAEEDYLAAIDFLERSYNIYVAEQNEYILPNIRKLINRCRAGIEVGN